MNCGGGWQRKRKGDAVQYEKWPAPGLPRRDTGESLCHHDHSESFPDCQLHGCNIVDSFPEGCPFRELRVMDALGQMQSEVWRERGTVAEGTLRSIRLSRRFETCEACVCRQLRHPDVQFLRSREQMSGEPAPYRSDGNGKRRLAPLKTGAVTYRKKRLRGVHVDG